MNVKKEIAGLLVVLSLGLAGGPQAWARSGGGGGHGGGYHGGSSGGGYHGGSFAGGYHGSVGGFHAYSMPSFGRSGFAAHGPALGGVAPMVRGGNMGGGWNNNRALNAQSWQHNGNWWNGNQLAGRGFGRGFDHRGFYGGFSPFYGGLGFYDPFLWGSPYSSWYGYGYPSYGYGPSYGYYSYGPDYGYAAAAPVYMGGYAPPPDVGGDAAAAPAAPAVADEAAPNGDWGDQFINSAREAFLKHEYANALRLAGHAAVETPNDAKVHELLALALFALKDYRAANMEAHAALALAPAADWPTLYRCYEDLPTYHQQLKDLEAYVRAHPDAADARFVLAYHYLMQGHKAAARVQFEMVLAKVPQDQVAAKLLKEAGGMPPAASGKAGL